MGSTPQNVTSWMERDENLQNMIQSNRLAHALGLKMAWGVKTWDQKFIKMI
jgi:hypothetical protein